MSNLVKHLPPISRALSFSQTAVPNAAELMRFLPIKFFVKMVAWPRAIKTKSKNSWPAFAAIKSLQIWAEVDQVELPQRKELRQSQFDSAIPRMGGYLTPGGAFRS